MYTKNIVIPMAGRGSRFIEAGFKDPKPLIRFGKDNKPMIQHVVESLNVRGNYIYLVLKEHLDNYPVEELLNKITPNCKIISVNQVTEGAACTLLLAREHIDNEQMLIVANSDQIIKWNPGDFFKGFSELFLDGAVLTFKADHPKWSYAKCDNFGIIKEVAEKRVISNDATVGIYIWNTGADCCKGIDEMISMNDRTNNEFYICPSLNYLIQDYSIFMKYPVDEMWGVGTPEDLTRYIEHLEGIKQ